MSRIALIEYDDDFASARAQILPVARSLIAKHHNQAIAVGRMIDETHSEAFLRDRIREGERLAMEIRNGQPFTRTQPRSAERDQPPTNTTLFARYALTDGDELRSARLDHAIETVCGKNRKGNLDRFLGANRPASERSQNLLHAIIVAGCVIDPDAGTWLVEYSCLAGCSWDGQPTASPRVWGRKHVCQMWGHNALGILREACAFANPGEGTANDFDIEWKSAESWAIRAHADAIKRVPDAVTSLRALSQSARTTGRVHADAGWPERDAAEQAIMEVLSPLNSVTLEARPLTVALHDGNQHSERASASFRGLTLVEKDAIANKAGGLLNVVQNCLDLLGSIPRGRSTDQGGRVAPDMAQRIDELSDALDGATGVPRLKLGLRTPPEPGPGNKATRVNAIMFNAEHGETGQRLDSPSAHAAGALIEPPAELNTSEQAILDALREAGRRLTTGPLLLKALGKEDGHGKSILASLVKQKRITNDPKARPRGYGLPDWR